MKKMMYILVMFCGLLIFSKNVKAEGYTCTYRFSKDFLMFELDNKIAFTVDPENKTINLDFEKTAGNVEFNAVLDFFVDTKYKDLVSKTKFGNFDIYAYGIEEDEKATSVLIDEVLDGKCARNIYVCNITVFDDQNVIAGATGNVLNIFLQEAFQTNYGILFNAQYQDEIHNKENTLIRSYGWSNIKGFDFSLYYILPAKNCFLVDIDQSNSTGEIVDVYSTECDFYSKYIEKNDEGEIVGGELYEKYQSQSLTEYEKEKEKLRSFCNSALKTGDYKIDPCVESCLGFTTDIQDIENINIPSGECNLSDRIISWVKNIIKWVKYIAPVLVIILGIMDFIKAIASSNEDAMKKAQARFIKRIIVAALVFIVPFLIEFVLNSFNLGADNPYCKII